MVLNEEDRILIKNLNYFKGYGAKRLISEFPAKGSKKTTVNAKVEQWQISAQQ